MNELFVHAGYQKTGSSYLQARLVASREALERMGYRYPRFVPPGHRSETLIASGNGRLLVEDTTPFGRILGARTIFSNEKLISDLADPRFAERMRSIMSMHNIERANILVFVRDPVEHAASMYQQSVKRDRNVMDVADFFARYEHPRLVRRVIDNLMTLEGVTLRLENYSRVRQALPEVFADWLGVNVASFEHPTQQIVNRSMTRSEIELLRRLNRETRTTGRSVADALCNSLPDVSPDVIVPPRSQQREMLERLAEDLKPIEPGGVVSHGIEYDLRLIDGNFGTDETTFSMEQLDVIASTLGREIGLKSSVQNWISARAERARRGGSRQFARVRTRAEKVRHGFAR